ncbi:MAG TPA: hypothetical protein VMX18_04370 [Candidatus Bipolaricaulota bacterium]|nr:hypothetical protein [Candidatus Bipolaricaulota bacterium]
MNKYYTCIICGSLVFFVAQQVAFMCEECFLEKHVHLPEQYYATNFYNLQTAGLSATLSANIDR